MLTLLHALTTFAPAQPSTPRPRLVVLIAIDQFRGDYFDRFGGQFTGGLSRLRDAGTLFVHGLQDHAITETAPGHSTMLSGRDPARTGIVSNSRGVTDATAPVVGSPTAPGASPRRFLGTALYDWMHAADTATRVLSVSRKDRGAILPVGRANADVYWYADGRFTTSTYYATLLPDWVQEYNRREGPARLAGSMWTLLLPMTAYTEPDSEPFENSGADFVFPHRMPADTATAIQRLTGYPWMDSLTLDFALHGVATLHLGQQGHTDLLVVSLSTTDAVGHAFGPDSRELHDQLLRVDHWLAPFLDSLQAMIPANRILYALTSDHGVQSLPEYTASVAHRPGGRVWLGDIALGATNAFTDRYRTNFALDFETGLLSADVASLRAHGVNVDSLSAEMVRDATGRRGIARVYTPRTLAAAATTDVDAARWKKQIPAGYGWLLAASLKPGFVWSSGRATAEHGSTTAPDLSVPILFAGAGIPARTYTRVVRTVDIAPTLASLLGVRPLERLDGVIIPEVAGRTAARQQ